MKKIVLGFLLIVGSSMAIEVGEVPSAVVIEGENGGNISGLAWNSSMLKGKVHVLFYVDPDEKDLNKEFVSILEKYHFNRKKYASVAIINLAATWKPNIIIEALLKKRQKKFPDTLYVKDKKKILVSTWKLSDNNSNVLVFDKKGILLYKKFGKLSTKEINRVLSLIERSL